MASDLATRPAAINLDPLGNNGGTKTCGDEIRFRLMDLLAVIAFTGTAAIFIIRAWVGLTVLEFGDETEKFVAAVMIRHGLHLYRDIFANHGPLPYLLAWVVALVTGTEDFSKARLVVVALAVAACWAVATSPALSRWAGGRLFAASLFLAPVSALWFVHPLHMLMYHALAGYLMMIVLAQLVLPAIAGMPTTSAGAFVSGASAVLAVAAAYSEAAPAALCLASATVAASGHAGWAAVRGMLFRVTAGGVAAAVPLVLWISLHADWTGLFVYHIYFNQVVYARMTGYSVWQAFRTLDWSLAPDMRVHTFALVAGTLGLAGAWRWNRPDRGWWNRPDWGRWHRRGWACRLTGLVLAAAAVLMLNPKGLAEFPDTPQVITACGLLAVALTERLNGARGLRLISGLAAALTVVVTGEVVARTALISPHGIQRADVTMAVLGPDPTDLIAAEVRRLVHPGETFLALPYWTISYLNAQRLPASGNYYYLPFQAEYDRSPILNWHIDLCADIERVRPPVVLLHNYPIGMSGPLAQFKPCVPDILARDYTPLPDMAYFYVRKDRM